MPVVPTHPVATPDPQVLSWVVPMDALPFCGSVARAPHALQALLDDATLAAIEVSPGAVVTMLGEGRTWVAEGARVRAALVDALGVPESWKAGSRAHAVGPDEVLQAAAQQIAAESVGAFAASHGGEFEVAQVRDGVVSVRLAGACHDCPAALITMKVRFERLLRRRCPWLVEVQEIESSPIQRLRRPNRP